MRTWLLSVILLSVQALTGLAQTPPIQITPQDGATRANPTARPARRAGQQMHFVVRGQNAGDVRLECLAEGSVASITNCPDRRRLEGGQAAIVIPVLFRTGEPGPGLIKLKVTPVDPAGNPTAGPSEGEWVMMSTIGPILHVSPQASGWPDPVHRLTNTSGQTVTFQVRNIGDTDARVLFGCSAPSGNLTISSCPPAHIVPADSTWGNEVVGFATQTAGSRSVQLIATPVDNQGNPIGTAVPGMWNITVVNPSGTVAPQGMANGATVLFTPGASSGQVFTVTNTATAATTFSLSATCPPGFSGCSAPASSGSLAASGGSTNVTATFTAGAAGSSGTLALEARYNGAVVASGNVNAVVPNASTTPDGGQATVAPSQVGDSVVFWVENTGAATATFSLSLPTCSGVSGCGFTKPAPRATTTTRSIVPGAGNKQAVVVWFDTPPSGSGSIVLRASFGGVSLNDGNFVITVNAPSITITPNGSSTMVVGPGVASSKVFDLTNTGPAATFNLSAVCPGGATPPATGCSVTSPAGGTITLGASGTGSATGSATVSFTGGTTQGAQGTVTLEGRVAGALAGSGGVTVHVAKADVPDLPAATPYVNSMVTATFTVQNKGNATATFIQTAVCGGVASGCSVTVGSSLTLAPNGFGNATVQYNTGATPGTGTVTLEARHGLATGPILDTGTQSITTQAQPLPMSASVSELNPGGILPRDQCVTLALGSGAASECGDLRLVHPLPTVRTMNTARTPTLVYSSAHARPWVNVIADLTQPSSGVQPTTVTVEVWIGSVKRGFASWAGNQWAAGATRRVSVGFDAAAQGLASGIHDYTLQVISTFAGGGTASSQATGKVVVMDRRNSPYGAGWWVAGLEQLNLANMTWTGGDGSVKQYVLRAGTVAPNRIWDAPSISYPDVIREAGGEYVRQLPDSVWVYFNSLGRHVRTRNRQGHLTQFGYDGSGRLSTITVPTQGSGLVYNFAYNGNGLLATVTAPGDPSARVVTVTTDAATKRITSIQDPGTPVRIIGFGYTGDNRVTSRTNARLVATTFQYDAASQVRESRIDMGGGSGLTRTITSLAVQGTGGQSVPNDAPSITFDGPRTDVSDVTVFTVNKYSAPTVIRDAHGLTTGLTRHPTLPGLVTYMWLPNGHWVQAAYDGRGRILTKTEPTPAGNGTTSYEWHSVWDTPTKITTPAGQFVEFGVGANGNRLWEQDGRGQSARTTYTYDAFNQVWSVARPGVNPEDLQYDAMGNLNASWTSLDFATLISNNGIGLPVTIQSPIGDGSQPQGAPFKTETKVYDARNQETSSTVTVAGGESTTTTKGYDAEGNLLGVTRSWTPMQSGGAPLTTTWAYDNANRAIQQNEPDGSFELRAYDGAGNLGSVTTRRGASIGMSYDALNRMLSRTIPATTYSGLPLPQISPVSGNENSPYSYSRPAETQTFQYTPTGQMTVANGLDANVTRTYHSSGFLLSESLSIRNHNRSGFAATYTQTYTGDKNLRRTQLALGPGGTFPGSAMGYSYDPVSGLPAGASDIRGNSYGFAYNVRNELTHITYPGAVTQQLGYDQDGRLASDAVTAGATGAFAPPSPQIRAFTVGVRDGAGKIRSSSDVGIVPNSVVATYSAMGYLLNSRIDLAPTDDFGLPLPSLAVRDSATYDGLGNVTRSVLAVQSGTSNPYGFGVAVGTKTNSYNGLGRVTGHLVHGVSQTSFSYDGAGNQVHESTLTFDTPVDRVTQERRSYYGADDRLLAVDVRSFGKKRLEEYRYDALGRRIWVRLHTDCAQINDISCVNASVRRTVWDGNQELAEVQVPYDPASPAGSDSDLSVAWLPYSLVAAGSESSTKHGDPNPYFGRVVYGPTLGIDLPVSVTRYGYRDRSNTSATPLEWTTPFTLSLLWDHRGTAVYGLLSSGKVNQPHTPTGGQTTCPALTTTGSNRCLLFSWAQYQSAYDRSSAKAPLAWHGTLVEGKRDGSGFAYMRNRVYDGRTGRFTQEDPIGLAGGLNGYGFAEGDPVNFSDPFGLAPCPCGPPGLHGRLAATASAVALTRGLPSQLLTAVTGPLIVGASATVGNLNLDATTGAIDGGGASFVANSPSLGLSFDIGVKWREASSPEVGGSVSIGVGKHTGVTISNQSFMLNLGLSTPTASPVTPSMEWPKASGSRLMVPAAPRDATGVAVKAPQ